MGKKKAATKKGAFAIPDARLALIGSMGHGLRCILNSVIGYSEVLHDEMIGPLNAKQKNYTAVIAKNAKEISALALDIINFAKVETGRMRPSPSKFGMNDLLEKTLPLIKTRIPGRNIGLSLDAEKDMGRVNADKGCIQEVISSLVLDRAHVVPEGGTIRIRAAQIDSSIEIAVWSADGAKAGSYQGRLLDAFFRAKDPYVKKYQGVELGLFAAKKIAELSGAAIRVGREGPDEKLSLKLILPMDNG